MARLIRDGRVVHEEPAPFLSLEELNAGQPGERLLLQPGESPCRIGVELRRLSAIAVNFPVLTDGRGFSCARELRERGYRGELRAVGHFIRDQMFYLKRCGFNAFQPADDSGLEQALASLGDFSESYQAGIDQPRPLFRRRGRQRAR